MYKKITIIFVLAFASFLTYALVTKTTVFNLNHSAGLVQDENGLTVADYNKKVNNKEKTVLAYFKADWCVPCKKLKPIMQELTEEKKQKCEILIIDVDSNRDLSELFDLNTLPLFILYKNGTKVWERTGFVSKAELSAKIDTFTK